MRMAPIKERLLPRRIPKKSSFQDCYAYEIPGLLAFRVKPEAANIVGVGNKKQVKQCSKDVKKTPSLLPLRRTIIKAKQPQSIHKIQKGKKKVNGDSGTGDVLQDEIKKEPDNVEYMADDDKQSIKSIEDQLCKEKCDNELQKKMQIGQDETGDSEWGKKREDKNSDKFVTEISNGKGNVNSLHSPENKNKSSNGIEKKRTLENYNISDETVLCRNEQEKTSVRTELMTLGSNICDTVLKAEDKQNCDVHPEYYLPSSSGHQSVEIPEKISNSECLPRPLTDSLYWQPRVMVDKLGGASEEKESENLSLVENCNESENFIATLELMKVSKEGDIEMNETVSDVIKIESENIVKPKIKLPRTRNKKTIKSCISKRGKKKQKNLFQSMFLNSTALKKNLRVKNIRPVKVLGESSRKVTTRSIKKRKPKTTNLNISVESNNISIIQSPEAAERLPDKRNPNISQISVLKDLSLSEMSICEDAQKVGAIESTDILDEICDMDPDGDLLISESNNLSKESVSVDTKKDCDNMSWSSLQLLHLLKDLEKMRNATEKQCREVGKLKSVVNAKDSEIRVLKYKLHCYESDKLHHILKDVITEARCAPCGERESSEACSIVDKLMAYAREKDLC